VRKAGASQKTEDAGPNAARRLKPASRRERERIAIHLMPALLGVARKIHGGEIEARTAALCAACSLAGIVGWTPDMVAAIEGK
jgi:hypothetical protein